MVDHELIEHLFSVFCTKYMTLMLFASDVCRVASEWGRKYFIVWCYLRYELSVREYICKDVYLWMYAHILIFLYSYIWFGMSWLFLSGLICVACSDNDFRMSVRARVSVVPCSFYTIYSCHLLYVSLFHMYVCTVPSSSVWSRYRSTRGLHVSVSVCLVRWC